MHAVHNTSCTRGSLVDNNNETKWILYQYLHVVLIVTENKTALFGRKHSFVDVRNTTHNADGERV